ncbi:hypothetical protein KFE98_10230 [bacterium SCSIO 12741]|nr:hypothetical protein KFE98_10230 [bacterium SCSIO 12741]
MKKLMLLAVMAMSLGMISCEKCSTCTYQDPNRGTLTSEEVCGKSRQYDQIMEQYDENGWSCTKN